MKILQIIQKLQLRGAEIFTCQLSTELIKQNIQVDVVYLFDNESNSLDFGLKFIGLNANPAKKLIDFKAYRKLSQIIREGRYDIVQANSGDTLKYAVLSKVFFSWHSKLVFRNANRMSSFIHSPLQRMFNRWLLGKCDFFISVSENSRLDLIKLFHPAADLSITIPQATYTFEEVAAIKRDMPANEPVLIGVGSFVPEKNHIFLLDVFYKFYKTSGRGFLWLVGDGKLNAILKDKVSTLGIQERVRFWGYQRNVIPILKAADVFVIPSLIEGLPAVILEAMSCEIPVVASSVGGIPEAIEDDVTGICLPEWSVDNYVDAVQKILSDEPYKKRLVRQAKAKLLERFTVDKVAIDFGRQYQKLV